MLREQQPGSRMQPHKRTAAIAPTTGAVKYTHRACICPETIAGPSERAGFMEAPLIGPANIASKATTPPMASPAVMPFSLAPVETPRITNISPIVRTASSTQDCKSELAGIVAPSVSCVGKRQ